MDRSDIEEYFISGYGDVTKVKRKARTFCETIGFDKTKCEEIVIVVAELATNIVKYSKRGVLTFQSINEKNRLGIQLESIDEGPGLESEELIGDGYTTGISLGIGLGAVNRLMDEFEILPNDSKQSGSHIICKKWQRQQETHTNSCPYDISVASRAHPKMKVNGDSFIIKKWDSKALIGVVDGLGHGEFAHKASMKARQYIENHYDQPLDAIFRGTGRACRGTRGVVMALALFDWEYNNLAFASVGNIEVRVFRNREKFSFIVKRAIVGRDMIIPKVSKHDWDSSNVMVLHSDGIKSGWSWKEYPEFETTTASKIAQIILKKRSNIHDDATVVVMRNSLKR